MDEINAAATSFVIVAKKVVLSKKVYEDGWNAKEIIAHIVFYHEYYASVISAIADKKVLPLIDESLAKVNINSAKEYSKYSREELIHRFTNAHKLLTRKITELDDSAIIPYKKGGSVYNKKSYIEVIAHHIVKHTKDLIRKKRVK